MNPQESFIFIDRLLSGQRLTLTPPEFAQFASAMQVLADFIRKKSDEDSTNKPK